MTTCFSLSLSSLCLSQSSTLPPTHPPIHTHTHRYMHVRSLQRTHRMQLAFQNLKQNVNRQRRFRTGRGIACFQLLTTEGSNNIEDHQNEYVAKWHLRKRVYAEYFPRMKAMMRIMSDKSHKAREHYAHVFVRRSFEFFQAWVRTFLLLISLSHPSHSHTRASLDIKTGQVHTTTTKTKTKIRTCQQVLEKKRNQSCCKTISSSTCGETMGTKCYKECAGSSKTKY